VNLPLWKEVAGPLCVIGREWLFAPITPPITCGVSLFS
jgi:hypothetical protein